VRAPDVSNSVRTMSLDGHVTLAGTTRSSIGQCQAPRIAPIALKNTTW
jgi:hypothetical protein